jgi:hypothetical protein
MVGPLGVLLGLSAAATIEVDEDFDGGPPVGGDVGSSGSSHHRS